jgi:hypothetical protein
VLHSPKSPGGGYAETDPTPGEILLPGMAAPGRLLRATLWGQRLILKRASTSRPSGQWNDDDVLANGEVVGRIFTVNAAPVGSPWMWTFAFGYHRDRAPNHGYTATREAAMAAFAKSWRPG